MRRVAELIWQLRLVEGTVVYACQHTQSCNMTAVEQAKSNGPALSFRPQVALSSVACMIDSVPHTDAVGTWRPKPARFGLDPRCLRHMSNVNSISDITSLGGIPLLLSLLRNQPGLPLFDQRVCAIRECVSHVCPTKLCV